jgi:class 3 adenylate cyclase
MIRSFKDKLTKALGRSEFVITVNADIRGFSAFSRINESPNIAVFIKRFYLQMIETYFPSANFIKPTGDGLLMTFAYDENNLQEVANIVLTGCLRCLQDFPSICSDDPMINFEVPQLIGFGVARGTACCLYSGKEILDYSGHLLNLCSRLMELARPSGIVIDGDFLKTVLPEELRESFIEEAVYLRGIAEDQTKKVLYLKDYVEISELYLKPPFNEEWISSEQEIKVSELKHASEHLGVLLKSEPKSNEKITVNLVTPMKGRRQGYNRSTIDNFIFESDPRPAVIIPKGEVQKVIARDKLTQTTKFRLVVNYVPKKSKGK